MRPGARRQHRPARAGFGSGGPAAISHISGVVPVRIDVITAFVPCFKSGQIVPIAVTSASRSPLAPDVPSVVETGRRKLLLDLGITATPTTQPAFPAFVREQVGQLAPAVKGAGVKL